MTLFRCCLLQIIITSVLSGLSFSLLDSIQNKISVRHSLNVETDSCAFECESDVNLCVISIQVMTEISNDLAERRSI